MEPSVDLDSLKAQFIGKIYVNEVAGKPAPANLDGKEVLFFLFLLYLKNTHKRMFYFRFLQTVILNAIILEC